MIAFTCPISQSRSPRWKPMLVLLLTYSSSYFLPNRGMADQEQCRGGPRDGHSLTLAGRLLIKLTQFSLGINVALDENRANFRTSEMFLALPHPHHHPLVAFKPCSFQGFPSKLCLEGARWGVSRAPHSPVGQSRR